MCTAVERGDVTYDECLRGLEGVVSVVVPDLQGPHALPTRLLDLDGEHVVVRHPCMGTTQKAVSRELW